MERKEQTEILPDPIVGGADQVARDRESFAEDTNVSVHEKSRMSSPDESPPVRVSVNPFYDGAERGRNSDRQGPLGIGQSIDPVPVQRVSRGNPFGVDAQASHPTPSVVAGVQNVTFPNQMKVDKVTRSTFCTWRVKLKFAAINARCYSAYVKSMPGTDQDSAAMTLSLNSVPEMWHRGLVKQGSAPWAFHWVMDQFDGGKNESHVDDLDAEFRALKMGPKDTYESYVMRAGDIAENLRCNARWVTHTALVHAIVSGLPASFDSGKSSLRSNGRRMTLEEFCDEIKREARFLDIPKPRMP
jgi:hypothetical protein